MYKDFLADKKDNIDIEITLNYNNLSNSMLDKMEKTAEITIEFWMDVRSDFNRSKIYDSAVKISKNIKIIKDNYNELVNKNKYKNIKLLLLYYDFLSKIIFYEQDTIELRDKIISFNQDSESSTSLLIDNIDSSMVK